MSSAAHGTMLSLTLSSAALSAGVSYAALLTTAGSGSYLAVEAEL